jgi:hypothetical protein
MTRNGEDICAEVQRIMNELWDELDRQDMTIREMAAKTQITARGIYAWRFHEQNRHPNLYNLVDCALALGMKLKLVRSENDG